MLHWERTGRQELSMVISHNYKLERMDNSFLNISPALLGREAVTQVKLHTQKWHAHLQHNTSRKQKKAESLKSPEVLAKLLKWMQITSLEKPESFYSSQNTLFWGQLPLPSVLPDTSPPSLPLLWCAKGFQRGHGITHSQADGWDSTSLMLWFIGYYWRDFKNTEL